MDSPPASRAPGDGGAATATAAQQAWALYGRGEHAAAEALCGSILERHAEHAGALTLLGLLMAQSRRTAEAADLLGRAAARLPKDAAAHNNHGSALRDLNRPADALACYDRALSFAPDFVDAHYNRALVLHDLERLEEAVASYERALSLKPDHLAAYNNRGAALQALARFEEAVASYDRAIALKPDYAAAHNNRGTALHRLKRFERALGSCDRALCLKPDYVEAHNNRGLALCGLERFEEALASFDRALAIKPDYAEAHCNRGIALRELGLVGAALTSIERALALRPQYPEAYNNRGVAFMVCRRFAEAVASLQRALAIRPNYAEAWINQGAALHALRRFEEALSSYDRALALNAGSADAFRYRGITLQEISGPEAALASYQRALVLDPSGKFLQGHCLYTRMQSCDWNDFDAELARIVSAIERDRAVVAPFVALSLCDDPDLHRRVARLWAREECRPQRTLPPLRRYARHERVRIGYFSADFRNHAVSTLAAEMFETHDRSRFELTAFSLGRDVQDELRARVEGAFERFVPVFDKSDLEVALLARTLEIDIAVDLGGYTQHSRPQIFAHRAAPLQVSYLGYLGTMAADFMDYLIADEVIVPPELRRRYAEKIAYVSSYQVNDSKRRISERNFSRAELGLPASSFVFCCFNASYKITPQTFASWMRILAAVPQSVLLLLAGTTAAERNLREQAALRGIDPGRLVFAGKIPYGEYLARFRAADLFLDTLPYNAGTTASDALWAGLPVLTCRGEAFAARMAASILTAAGLPELIAADRSQYERLAVELATQRERFSAIKCRLIEASASCLLFDTRRFTRELESLYGRMYERHHLGLLPEHLAHVAV